MTWSTPKTYIVGEMITHTIMNTFWRDNISQLDAHAHSGTAGSGSADIVSLNIMILGDAGPPPGAAGTMRRVGNHLNWRGGASTFIFSNGSLAGGTAAIRSLGTLGTQIANGTHKHFEV